MLFPAWDRDQPCGRVQVADGLEQVGESVQATFVGVASQVEELLAKAAAVEPKGCPAKGCMSLQAGLWQREMQAAAPTSLSRFLCRNRCSTEWAARLNQQISSCRKQMVQHGARVPCGKDSPFNRPSGASLAASQRVCDGRLRCP